MRLRLALPAGVAGITALATSVAMSAPGAAAASAAAGAPTATPIKHVIVIIGENHSFDNVFATYQPPGRQHIENLLSEGIVTRAGTPGPDWSKARQLIATNTGSYTLTPQITSAYQALPPPNTTYVATGCDGLPPNSDDTRFPSLPNGPFQITKYVPYFDSHSGYPGG